MLINGVPNLSPRVQLPGGALPVLQRAVESAGFLRAGVGVGEDLLVLRYLGDGGVWGLTLAMGAAQTIGLHFVTLQLGSAIHAHNGKWAPARIAQTLIPSRYLRCPQHNETFKLLLLGVHYYIPTLSEIPARYTRCTQLRTYSV